MGIRSWFSRKKDMSAVSVSNRGWFKIIGEPFTGAWQRNEEEKIGSGICYPTLYACLSRISQDIGKLKFQVKAADSDGIWRAKENPAYSPVLRTPNGYQNEQQFRESWALSKLQHGNTYVLLGRDDRNVVNRMYILDPCRVIPMVTEAGEVFYQLNYPSSQNLLPESYPSESLVVPASEMIHDRMNTFHHQLIGVPPLCAAYWPAVKNLRILKNSAEFFGNAAQPGGILTAPAGMTEDDGKAIQKYWSENYAEGNRGKVAVIGADLKFTAFAMSSVDSQLVEQMRYSDEQICQPFGIPPFKIGIGSIPSGLGVDAINQLYYNDALQSLVQSMELLLTIALRAEPYRVDMDEMLLMRMDAGKKATYHADLIQGSIETTNEARRDFNLAPLAGGDTVYMQQQDFPLDQVRQNKIVDQNLNPVPAEPDEPDEEPDQTERALLALWKRSPESYTNAGR